MFEYDSDEKEQEEEEEDEGKPDEATVAQEQVTSRLRRSRTSNRDKLCLDLASSISE